MRKVKEILRLKWEIGLAARQIAHSLSISHSTVLDMLRRAERAGLTWPLPDIDEATLEAQLYPGNPEPTRKCPEPDMPVHSPGVAPQGRYAPVALGGIQAPIS